MKIKLIGFDSMGTRGMATVVDIEGFKIFIDPGVSYAPRRYGLPPHPIELEVLEKHLETIHREITDSHIVVISHYHRDHYLYRDGEEEYYRNKVLLIKDPVNNINHSQRIRAYVLLEKRNVKNLAKEVRIADEQFYEFENIRIYFSKPLPHGPDNTRLGYVLATVLEYEDFRLLHASDVQGPISRQALEYIVSVNPTLLIISGPPTYFEGYKMDPQHIREGFTNLLKIVESLRERSTVVVDHHLLRDLNYYDKLRDIIEIARLRNISVLTAAEYMGLDVRPLEAMRKQLWMRERNQ
ncbi:MAG: hypothetical protein ABWW65_03195 [Thermoprotei archaeon]